MTSQTDSAALALPAALALAAALPTDVPLGVRARSVDDVVPAGAGVSAKVVGAAGATLTLVVGTAVDAALESAGGSVVDVVRPALEAAALSLREGVVSELRDVASTEAAFAVEGTEVFALTEGEAVVGWFAVRVAPAAARTPGRPAQQGPTAAALRMLYDVEMTLTAEIGRAKLPVRQVLDLVPGSVIELDRVAGAPADLMVNGHLVARGEVVVVDEDYGLRITEIVDLAHAGL
ncbi:flagellar motor switch protein FliN [Sanguibacter sp. HDW7]|uniref:flagellar motor switch protein FliN n=1 Tax=Sanguibacter sp. HDW7 TaxID=2714931 RepID=UPI00140B93EF|nr:flagellar motor switch protein FliN [Sanguibacter sp. HDW7]QIK84296.1 flagellar motor switch protein FliN [Sanguibacter sp. HDW7]